MEHPPVVSDRTTFGDSNLTYNDCVWPGRMLGKRARNNFLALLEIVGTPSKAKDLMQKLELWEDDRRPPESVIKDWTNQFRQRGVTTPEKVLESVQKSYDAALKADMDSTLGRANEAHRTISSAVIEGDFDKDTSGALQHLGQFISIGTEKRHHAYAVKQRSDEGIPLAPTFLLMPPPERRALPEPATEVEVVRGS